MSFKHKNTVKISDWRKEILEKIMEVSKVNSDDRKS